MLGKEIGGDRAVGQPRKEVDPQPFGKGIALRLSLIQFHQLVDWDSMLVQKRERLAQIGCGLSQLIVQPELKLRAAIPFA